MNIMKKLFLIIIISVACCFSAGAQIVSSRYNDSYGSPFFRVDVLKSSYSSSEGSAFIPTNDGYHGMGVNASIGYYVPIYRTYFFYAPEIGLTGRFGNNRIEPSDTYYNSYFGLGLRAVPLQFGYSFEITSSFSVNPRVGAAATLFPFGSITSKGGESQTIHKWGDSFESFDFATVIGCDLVFRDSNLIISLALESGLFSQAGLGIGFLF